MTFWDMAGLILSIALGVTLGILWGTVMVIRILTKALADARDLREATRQNGEDL